MASPSGTTIPPRRCTPQHDHPQHFRQDSLSSLEESLTAGSTIASGDDYYCDEEDDFYHDEQDGLYGRERPPERDAAPMAPTTTTIGTGQQQPQQAHQYQHQQQQQAQHQYYQHHQQHPRRQQHDEEEPPTPNNDIQRQQLRQPPGQQQQIQHRHDHYHLGRGGGGAGVGGGGGDGDNCNSLHILAASSPDIHNLFAKKQQHQHQEQISRDRKHERNDSWMSFDQFTLVSPCESTDITESSSTFLLSSPPPAPTTRTWSSSGPSPPPPPPPAHVVIAEDLDRLAQGLSQIEFFSPVRTPLAGPAMDMKKPTRHRRVSYDVLPSMKEIEQAMVIDKPSPLSTRHRRNTTQMMTSTTPTGTTAQQPRRHFMF